MRSQDLSEQHNSVSSKIGLCSKPLIFSFNQSLVKKERMRRGSSSSHTHTHTQVNVCMYTDTPAGQAGAALKSCWLGESQVHRQHALPVLHQHSPHKSPWDQRHTRRPCCVVLLLGHVLNKQPVIIMWPQLYLVGHVTARPIIVNFIFNLYTHVTDYNIRALLKSDSQHGA